MTRKRAVVTTDELAVNSQADWNAFVALLATTDCDDLEPLQRSAHFIFWYESEMANGGHLQYFTNRTSEKARQTVATLYSFGASDQARVLEKAFKRWEAAFRLAPADDLEFTAIALEAEFEDLDQEFHSSTIPLLDVPRQLFDNYKDEFIERQG